MRINSVCAENYYMNGDGSEDCRNLQECFGIMHGGDTLIIRDGTYVGAENVISNSSHPPQGISRNKPTTIWAENVGKVFFDGENNRAMFIIGGTAGGRDWLRYWTFTGIQWIRSSERGVFIASGVNPDERNYF